MKLRYERSGSFSMAMVGMIVIYAINVERADGFSSYRRNWDSSELPQKFERPRGRIGSFIKRSIRVDKLDPANYGRHIEENGTPEPQTKKSQKNDPDDSKSSEVKSMRRVNASENAIYLPLPTGIMSGSTRTIPSSIEITSEADFGYSELNAIKVKMVKVASDTDDDGNAPMNSSIKPGGVQFYDFRCNSCKESPRPAVETVTKSGTGEYVKLRKRNVC